MGSLSICCSKFFLNHALHFCDKSRRKNLSQTKTPISAVCTLPVIFLKKMFAVSRINLDIVFVDLICVVFISRHFLGGY